ncbi:MAG TPA: hypothetical protein VFV00_15985 [Acidimicrobiales bacterium]|nr:hypothetical protein [Acidimicrobiales bacterium]
MRVLVVESDRYAANGAIADLQAAGHHVLRCHEEDLPAFPCNALCDGGRCPLEDGDGIDVVVDYRTRPYPRPTPFEDGASCALRHHVPLVVAGTSALNPFAPWTTAISTNDEDLVTTCEHAVEVPLERLAAPARAEVRRRLRLQPGVAEATDVVVRRRQGGQLDAVVRIPEEAEEIDGELAVAVAGVLRAEDRFAPRVNVAVERRPRRELMASGPSAPAR